MALTDKLTAIADAIRGKTGGIDPLTLEQMVAEIEGISPGGGGIQKASGTYVLTEDIGSMAIDINDIGFIPDFAIVYLDETDLIYDTSPTKMWILCYIPEILELWAVNKNLAFTRTNFANLSRGAQGTDNQQVAPISINYVGYKNTNDPTVRINVARSASSYPIIAGTYKWSVYKIWEDE